jgi:DNA-binding NarL/FixJ family response regulator
MATVAWAYVALAVVVSPPRAGAAWLLVSVLGYLAALWVTGLTPREWIRGDAVASVSERVLGFILIAGAVLAALILIRRILWNSRELHGLFRPVAASSAAAAVGTLTDTELRVILFLADGCTVAQIASETNYAETTIHGFVASAKKKIGARSRPQLVAIVIGTTVPRR